MTGKHKGTGRLAAVGCLWLALLISGFFFCAGCAEGIAPKTAVDPTGTVPSERTEAQLLAELDRKFENPRAHYELAHLYHQSQQWTKAEYHYNVALGFDPAHKAAQAGLVKMFVDRGETAKAEQYANSYIRQAARYVRETLRLGWEFEKLGLDAYALRCFRQALDAAPDSAEANKQTGFYYLGKGDTARAKQYLMRSFELNPRQSDVAGALGRLGIVVESPQPPEMEMEEKR
jgi:tetratricopeptide (TPR) repeat protein